MPLHPSLIRFVLHLCCAWVLAVAAPALADGRAGDFDFYVLALTWTPTYCATDDDPDPAQCSTATPHGFLVHGLWPQYETGYPEYCPSSYPRGLRRSTLDAISSIMPSAGLARYEWRKHGMCSGLSEAAYFGLMLKAAEKVAVPPTLRRTGSQRMLSPDAIEAAFVSANPGLRRDGIAVMCSARKLVEVRVCLTKDLQFRRCLDVDDDGCRSASISVPPTQ